MKNKIQNVLNKFDDNLNKFKNKFKNILKFLGLFILFFTISSIPIAIFGIDITKFSNIEVIVYSFICNIVYLIIIVSCYFKTLKKDFKPFFKNFINNLEEAFKYYFIGLAIMITSNLIITNLLNGGLGSNEEAVRNYINIAPFIMFLEVSLYAPFSEELLFRKSIRDIFKNKWIYVLVSGLIFGGLHVTQINSLFDLLYLIPYCSLGFTFAYTYVKTDNIFSTITIHALHNTTTIILYLIGASLW